MPRNNYFSIYDDSPDAIDPNSPTPPFVGDGGSGGSSGNGSGGGYGGGSGNGSGGSVSSKNYPKDPYSNVDLNTWWGQLPFYLEKGFLETVNRDSGLYKNFQSQLMKTLGGQFSTNSLLGLNMGTGGDYGSSQFLANEKMKQLQGRISDTAVGATDQFYSGMQQQGTSLLNLMLQDRTALYNRDAQKMIAELNQPSGWDKFWGALGGLGGAAIKKWG